MEIASSARGVTGAARIAAGYQPGTVWLLTNLCLFRLNDDSGRFEVVETLPGISHAAIIAATGFEVNFAVDCVEMGQPDDATLTCLRQQIDPLGLRRLEFSGARDRGPLFCGEFIPDRRLGARSDRLTARLASAFLVCFGGGQECGVTKLNETISDTIQGV